MTIKKRNIVTRLRELGWREFKSDEPKKSTFYKRFASRYRCGCNDDKDGMQLVVSVWDEWQPEFRPSCEIDIAGELPDGMWVNFEAYGINDQELEAKIDRITALLLLTWEHAADITTSNMQEHS